MKKIIIAVMTLAFAVPAFASLKEGLYKGIDQDDDACYVEIYNVEYNHGKVTEANATFKWVVGLDNDEVVTDVFNLTKYENGIRNYSETPVTTDGRIVNHWETTYFIELDKDSQMPVSYLYLHERFGSRLYVDCKNLEKMDR